MACTLGGGVVAKRLGWTEGGGIGDGLAIWHGAWHVDEFTGGILDGRMVGWALGLQFLATTV